MTTWLPINSAPRDGTEILIWHELGQCRIVFWKSLPTQEKTKEGYWAYPGEDHFGTETCRWWMPLPEPPKKYPE